MEIYTDKRGARWGYEPAAPINEAKYIATFYHLTPMPNSWAEFLRLLKDRK